MSTTATTKDLTQLLAGAHLPALPQSAIRLLELSQDPDNGPAEFALPIETDPGLAGQVLRFVNSSYFGFAREISAVKQAITLVGIRTIKNFALWSAVFSLMPNPKCGPFDLKSLWQDSLRRGLFARAAGKLMGQKDSEDLFAAALLQDMAIPLLAKELPKEYADLLGQRQDGKVRLSTLEQERFGWTHAQAGGMLAKTWNLPESFGVYLSQHASLEELLAAPTRSVGPVAVALSSLLPSVCDSVWHDGPAFETAYGQVVAPGSPPVAETFAQIDAQFKEFAPMMKLALPNKSLVDQHNELAAAV